MIFNLQKWLSISTKWQTQWPFFIPVRDISLKGVETLYGTDAFATQLVDELVCKMATCQVANCGINSHIRF